MSIDQNVATVGRSLVIAVALSIFAGCSGEPASPLLSVVLDGIDGPVVDLSELGTRRASVLVFMAPDCPLSQNHTLTLNDMAGEFSDDDIAFYGIVAGNWYSDKEISAFRDTYSVGFPIGVDRDYVVTDMLGARVTPEVFVVGADGTELYAGAIDNWAGSLAKHRTITTEHYLRDALTDVAEGRPVGVEPVTAVGCFIEREG